MATKNKDWFDTHFEVMTFDGNKTKEKKLKATLKKAIIKDAGKFLKSNDGKNYLKLKTNTGRK
jgi:hypothetical protein